MSTADRRVALGRLFRRSKILGYVEEQMLSVYRERGVVVKDEALNPNKTADDRSIYQLVEPGWLVVNRMKAWQGSVGVADLRGIVSGHYICFQPVHNENHRYLHYLLRSPASTSHFAAISRGVRPGQMEIDNDDLATAELLLPPVEEQQQIADFLDDQVARIDNIIAARREQQALFNGATLNVATDLLRHLGPRSGPPLSAITQIVDTEHKTARETDGGGHWSAWTGAIRNGEVVRPLLREIDVATYREWTRRMRPAAGDVLLTREAPVGEVALLEDNLPIAIGQRVVLLHPTLVDSAYLRLVLMSSVLDRLIVDTTQGSLHPHLNMSDIARLRVPQVELRQQLELGRSFTDALANLRHAVATMRGSVLLLEELKRSLITAAVTGEFDVSSADGSQVPVA